MQDTIEMQNVSILLKIFIFLKTELGNVAVCCFCSCYSVPMRTGFTLLRSSVAQNILKSHLKCVF